MTKAEVSDRPGLMQTKPRFSLGAAYAAFERLEPHDQTCFLTLPLLMLYVDEYWYVNVPVVGLALAGLLFANIRGHSLFWFTLTCFTGAGVFYNWLSVDNHKYLLSYWCLAVFCSLLHPRAAECLSTSARYLIGLLFTLAVFWKVWSPDFLSGDFLHFQFLFDSRFEGKLKALGLADPRMFELNDVAQRALASYDSNLSSVQLVLDSNLHRAAVGLSWWTLLMEAAIAIAFLAPRGSWVWRTRHVLLLAFVGSTYAIAPVIGFGWLLVVMGFVQCDPSWRKTRMFYLSSLLLLQAFRLPWSTISDAMTSF
jgi:hypothetical protein